MRVRRDSAVGEQGSDGGRKSAKAAKRPPSEERSADEKRTPVRAAASSAEGAAPARGTASSAKKAAPPAKRTGSAEKTATSAEKTATSAEKTTTSAEKTATSAEKTTTPAKKVAAIKKAPSPRKQVVAPVKATAAVKTAPAKAVVKPAGGESRTALVRRARRINRALAEVYPYAHPELDFENPFQLVVATVLSAQTTDLRVNQTTPALFAKYPTPEDLAAANPEEVEEILRPTGFFRAKTKSVIGLSKALAEDFGGEVPGRLEDLVKLPGVGRKTAFVVLGNAFGRPGITVDTHFQRLVRRWRWTAETDPDKIEAAIGALFPKSDWTDLSHHVIWHGRRICHARKPACGACPIAALCPAYGEGETDPEKAEKLLKYEKGGLPGQRLRPPQAYLDAGGRPAPPLGAG